MNTFLCERTSSPERGLYQFLQRVIPSVLYQFLPRVILVMSLPINLYLLPIPPPFTLPPWGVGLPTPAGHTHPQQPVIFLLEGDTVGTR